MKNVFQLKITLKNISPPIWRRIGVNSNILLPDLHNVIQVVMGWTDSHLHQFVHNDYFYCDPSLEDDWYDDKQIDYSNIKLNQLLSLKDKKIVYEYDFGDGWEHIVELEKIIPIDKNLKNPICLKGKRNCPPEDCGGVFGYENLLKIIKDPNHEEYGDMIEWVGENFNSEYFDKDEINKILKKGNFNNLRHRSIFY
jgi:hypothetical protein